MTYKSRPALILEKTKDCVFQLVKHDLGCQNIFGQNKGLQK